MKCDSSFTARYGWLLIILLSGAFLRLHDIAETPPGITHDEADHGITALSILDGAREIYFTVGYGREPFFDYSTAVIAALIGPTYLAGRLTAALLSLVVIAVMYAWTLRAFDQRTALLTAAGLAVGFWAVMTGRQSLRSITLPVLYLLALAFFWRGVEGRRFRAPGGGISPFWVGGIALGLTFYSYIPARILWVLFPLVAIYAALRGNGSRSHVWRGTGMMLLIAIIVASPLFTYLLAHPEAELRIRQLSEPLTAAAGGDLRSLIQNMAGGLGIITFSGDAQWRYNLPGKPFLQPLMGLLFYLGLAASVWRLIRSPAGKDPTKAHFVALSWMLLGISPALVTGPQLSTTQAIGMQPVLYLFPALGLVTLYEVRFGRVESIVPKRLALLLVVLLFAGTAVVTARDYFVSWADAPEVRVQYETTMVAALEYLSERNVSSAAISTINPGQYHSQAVARMVSPDIADRLRWFDGRHSLLLPGDKESLLLVPGFTPLAPELAPYFESAPLIDSLSLRPSDMDKPLLVYALNNPILSADWKRKVDTNLGLLAAPVNFGNAVELLGFDLFTPVTSPGATIKIATLWRIERAVEDVVLFTHVQGEAGDPVAQADRLDVPSSSWKAGDMFLQLHQLAIPDAAQNGTYPVVVGICQRLSGNCTRLPFEAAGISGDLYQLASLTVAKQ